ncbi:hypothetical protein A2153_00715 [Candidatus Gottesmanbacteria bacterium RBG_16_38_7b]|uniref:Glycosyltransferase RgtA/B/C/D-like domain-containing protein n=1 Tax=Candidatus Gottesmanbacteria bacterium RBG_16_38_7b TaxID=1798372 RepID=A0A1F5YFH1_9BACT|nr:MAG: hypothetical protein A2153_00715 [Candidatus Gottesmanbacteria bacterium RBG_16_38_7b]
MTTLIYIVNFFIRNYLPYLTIFLLSLNPLSDSDFGWHLKYGEYFFKTGQILRKNVFSLEMPDYRWVNSSWLTDVVTYYIFKMEGFLGITIAGGLIVMLMMFFLSRAYKFSFWEKTFIFPLILFVNSPLTRVSFRGQLLSLLGVTILLYLLEEYKREGRNIIYLTIPLFFIWANLHGGFMLGLAIMIIYLAIRQLATKSLDKKLLAVFPLIILSTLINPFGIEIYQEVIKHFGNPFQNYIVEWVPLTPFSDLWWVLIFWGIFLIINIRILVTKEKLADYIEVIILTLIFYFLSHWMRRYAWTMYLISIPLSLGVFRYGIEINRQIKKIIPVIIWVVIYLGTISYYIPSQRLTQINWQRYCLESVKCSIPSAEFLKKIEIPQKFLSFYNWGGWLIWNYPEIKPLIDGRMHLWRDEGGYSAFGKYYFLEQNVDDIDKSDYEMVYMIADKPVYKRLLELVRQGRWRIIYQDDLAGVFVRVTGNGKSSGTTRVSGSD